MYLYAILDLLEASLSFLSNIHNFVIFLATANDNLKYYYSLDKRHGVIYYFIFFST